MDMDYQLDNLSHCGLQHRMEPGSNLIITNMI